MSEPVSPEGPETSFGRTAHSHPPEYAGVVTTSRYLTMRDGVRIAIDLVLPKDLIEGTRLPTVLMIARYWRSFALRLPNPPDKAPMGPRDPVPDFLVPYGYAMVLVDVRGSGASFGSSKHPWSREEIEDYGEVVDWIVDQPWSDGKVGAIGISYEGAAAELLAAARPEAVKAVVPQQTETDLYTGIISPGGIYNKYFMSYYQKTNDLLDNNQVPKSWGWSARLFVKGVRPVDEDRNGSLLSAAMQEHTANLDVYESTRQIKFRDDLYGPLDLTLDDFSPYQWQPQIEASGAAIFGWGSWMDGTTAEAVLQRFVDLESPQLAVIGAWGHRLHHHGSPFGGPRLSPIPDLKEGWLEALAFFDDYLKAEAAPIDREKQLVYFTLGEERWKTSKTWPPAGMAYQRWYLAEGFGLSSQPPVTRDGVDRYEVDFEASTGKHNRWHSADGVTGVSYPDRAQSDQRLLTYTSPVMPSDYEITGHAVVTLYLASDHTDGAFFVYLEDVDENGRVTYITEGQLRALHRKVSAEPPPFTSFGPYHTFRRADQAPLVPGEVAEISFVLQPISVLIRPGHRLRVAIAGHDKDTFLRVPAQGNPVISLQRNTRFASWIDLPVIPRG